MATEKDFELLDDYLSNRMKGQDKMDFEKNLESDPSLRNELGLQKEFIEGIKRARVAELKAMLNEIATPAPTNSSFLGKAGLAVAVAIVGVGLYFMFNKSESVNTTPPITKEEPVVIQSPAEEAITNRVEEDVVATPQREEPSKEETGKTKANTKPSKKDEVASAPLKQPSLEPYDPTKELEHTNGKPDAVEEDITPSITNSSIAVETDNSNKKLDFHYQFKDGKLFLLGSFEKDLYEILEFFNNNKRTIFLYYNSGYYLLDEGQTQPTPLKAINDPALLQKLKASRGK